jgi:hypothetical protein
MWDSFASAWDEVVADLREADLVGGGVCGGERGRVEGQEALQTISVCTKRSTYPGNWHHHLCTHHSYEGDRHSGPPACIHSGWEVACLPALLTQSLPPRPSPSLQISNREADNLRFTRLCYDAGLEVSGVRPLLLPAFFYAGALQVGGWVGGGSMQGCLFNIVEDM